MAEIPGTSVLNDEQRAWMREKYGVTYVAVQDNAGMPSRKVRRKLAKAKR